MREVRLAMVGFGNVAQGLTTILRDQDEAFIEQHGIKFIITSVADTTKGSVLNPDGLDPAELLEAARQPGGLRNMDGGMQQWDAMEMIQSSPADVLVEMSNTNLENAEPATTYIAEALRRKKHVVTTNKGPIALHFDMLASIARLHDVEIGVEGTVMSGSPVLRVGRELLAPAGIRRMQGILNGTTNYILTKMETGLGYTEALAGAQAQGYAEADPTSDVDGYDAAAKVAILGRLVLGKPLPYTSIERQGITGLTLEDIAGAKAEGKRWKLVGTIENDGGTLRGRVQPECLPLDHPLAQVSGIDNALVFTTDLLGDVTIVGPGAGRKQTGYAIIQDLFCIYRNKE